MLVAMDSSVAHMLGNGDWMIARARKAINPMGSTSPMTSTAIAA